MALKYSLKDDTELNALPEGSRSLYKKDEHDGTYALDLELPEGYGVENVTGLKTALAKERDNAKTAAKALRDAEERLQGAGSEALEAEVKTLRETITASEGRLQKAIAGSAITLAIAEHKGNPELLTALIEKRVTVKGNVTLVLDEQGDVREGITVSNLLSEMRDSGRFDGAFAGLGQSGGSTSRKEGESGASGAKPTNLKRSTMTVSEKAAYVGEHGTDKYMEIPWA